MFHFVIFHGYKFVSATILKNSLNLSWLTVNICLGAILNIVFVKFINFVILDIRFDENGDANAMRGSLRMFCVINITYLGICM